MLWRCNDASNVKKISHTRLTHNCNRSIFTARGAVASGDRMQDTNKNQEIVYTRPSVYGLMQDAQQIAVDMAALPEDLTTPDAAEQLAAFEHKFEAWLASASAPAPLNRAP